MSIILAPLFLANSITLLGVLIIFGLVSYLFLSLVAASFLLWFVLWRNCVPSVFGLSSRAITAQPFTLSPFTLYLFFYCRIRRTVLAPPPTVTQHSAGEIGFRSYRLSSLRFNSFNCGTM
jgi:hypothetical protein